MEGLGRVPVADAPVGDVRGFERLGQGGEVRESETVDEVFGDEEDRGELVLRVDTGEPRVAQAEQLVGRAIAEVVVAPEPANGLADAAHRDPTEPRGAL